MASRLRPEMLRSMVNRWRGAYIINAQSLGPFRDKMRRAGAIGAATTFGYFLFMNVYCERLRAAASRSACTR
jgi:hypothetical protein